MNQYFTQNEQLDYLNSPESEQFKRCKEKSEYMKKIYGKKGFSYLVSDLEKTAQQVRIDLQTEDKSLILQETVNRLNREGKNMAR